MKNYILILSFVLFNFGNASDIINIYPEKITHKISPLIYGSNQTLIPKVTTAMRQGGNRMTGYNWVNNYSNAGSDWFHSSDDYIPWAMQIPKSDYEKTGIALTKFHQINIESNCYSLLTLPMAGYVAKDKNGDVFENEVAPSNRWAKVINKKNRKFDLKPAINSDTVYVDECLNFLNDFFKNTRKIDAFSLDNEPCLWANTHPRIHPEKITIKELIEKSADLAKTVKELSPNSEIFGPALYGFNAYYSLQDAPDWNAYKSQYPRFIDAYLDLMNKESQKAGKRLIDVLDVHWYPEPEGVYSDDTSRAASIRRMEAIRSLWDSTYTEESWIGQWYSPVAILKYLKNSANKYYPNTKIGITEYNYSGNNHISGGIAQALFLGVLGKEDIYFASKWDFITEYNKSAFEIFRNYDGNYSKYGNLNVENDSKNNNGLTIFSSIDSEDSLTLHIIAINSDYDKSRDIEFKINSKNKYKYYDFYQFKANSKKLIDLSNDSKIIDNTVKLTIPNLSVNHFIIKSDQINSVFEIKDNILISPNPASDYILVCHSALDAESNSSSPSNKKGQGDALSLSKWGVLLEIYNIVGEKIPPRHFALQNATPQEGNLRIDVSNLPAGIYFVRIGDKFEKFIKL